MPVEERAGQRAAGARVHRQEREQVDGLGGSFGRNPNLEEAFREKEKRPLQQMEETSLGKPPLLARRGSASGEARPREDGSWLSKRRCKCFRRSHIRVQVHLSLSLSIYIHIVYIYIYTILITIT